ncbi:hypothetical protein AB0A71_24270 [Kitasatospora aureofaciens]|uniref:hypothetical protein n=1 Tax=Kitasatospora aureofaciens TaxID=1894 RepID=UPI0033DFEFEF
MVGGRWLDDNASWYGLVTPLSAPIPQRGDLVTVVTASSPTAGMGGRTWTALARVRPAPWKSHGSPRRGRSVLTGPSAVSTPVGPVTEWPYRASLWWQLPEALCDVDEFVV